ncbi:hypothetical protein ACWC3X_43155 [Streptomyces populi]
MRDTGSEPLLRCPRTPLRRFLDRELSAGAHLLRKSFRARDHSGQILPPGPGVGVGVSTETGNVGTAIDYRLSLAFATAEPVDPVARQRHPHRHLELLTK